MNGLQGPIFPGQESYAAGDIVGALVKIGTVPSAAYEVAVWSSIMYQFDPADPMEGWVGLAEHPHPRLHTLLISALAGSEMPTPDFDGVCLRDLLAFTTPDVLFCPLLDADLAPPHPCSPDATAMVRGSGRVLRLDIGVADALIDVWAFCVAADPITDDLRGHAIWFDLGLIDTAPPNP